MADGWNTSISVGIHRDCPMEFRTQRGGVVEFWACRGTDEFDLSFELDALRRFLELGASAVAEAEARVATERTNSEDSVNAGHGVNRGAVGSSPPRARARQRRK